MCAFFLVEGQCPKNGSDDVGLHGHSLFFAGPLRFGQGDAWVWVKFWRVPKNRMVYSRNEKHMRSCKAQFWSHTHIIHSFKTENLQTGKHQTPKKGPGAKLKDTHRDAHFANGRGWKVHGVKTASPSKQDTCILMMTSGTTGRPKTIAGSPGLCNVETRRKLLPGSNITRHLCALQSSTGCNVYIPW